MASSIPDLSGLTPGQREYFRILEGMEPDASLQRAIKSAKASLIAQARKAKLEDSARSEAEEPDTRSLSYSGDEGEVILRILLDEEESGYYARVSDAVTGSESDRSGETIAETVGASLDWAGVQGLKLDPEATVAEIRSALAEASEGADFELTVQLYTSF